MEYQKPVLFPLTGMGQAMGAACQSGTQATGTGDSCNYGPGAGGTCGNGGCPTYSCAGGSNCSGGAAPTGICKAGSSATKCCKTGYGGPLAS